MSDIQRERDLVLSPNEYAYVLDKTKGLISCVVGSYKMSLSNSDSLVVFNEHSKRFEEAGFAEAITTFVTAPENWYIVLKNPAMDNKHPTIGTSNSLPELQIGKKVNIKGNVSFALYPGQMAKVIQGHRLHCNQYLLARVYDADVLEKEDVLDNEGKPTGEHKNKYENGQLLIIKGTDVSFYIPPTGIEVVPVGGKGNNYIRDAVTLEKLEYCILKNEEGEKKYIHGSAVVFPEPDEEFIKNSNGGYKFKAIELSDISGIYVKVVSDYKDNGKEYKAGEELFITGKEQMIYYPRPEHAIIDYEGKILHHAIAIPEGEGRYILERKTGKIKTIKGSAMYLVNPINEVVVKRKLTRKQCELWYPGNEEVLRYNGNIPAERRVANMDSASCSYITTALNNGFYGQENAVIDDSGFSRGNTYSKPRTITIDNKYDGVVSIDVWTGYAINIVSKSGERKVIVGPQTYLMEYDEVLEAMELSTGKPKTTDNLLRTVYLRIDNNKISDVIEVKTKDFVTVYVNVSYCVDFLKEHQDKWFSVENYVKYLCDRMRSLVKRKAKDYTIEEFYANATDIVRGVVLASSDTTENNAATGRLFKENGMFVHDVDILSVNAEADIQDIMDENQRETVEKSLKLTAAEKDLEVAKELSKAEQEQARLSYETASYRELLKSKYEMEKISNSEKQKRAEEAAELASHKATESMQAILNSIQDQEIGRKRELYDLEEYRTKKMNDLETAKQAAYTDAVKKVIDAISPDLIASMTSSANAELLKAISSAMSPYAMANGESVAEVTNKLLRGTSLEGLLKDISAH
mgnify:CR=1 FL=1